MANKKIDPPPKIIHNIGKSIYGLIPFAWRAGPYFRETLRILDETQYLSKIQLQELQMSSLCRLIDHAYANVPYYHRLFNELGINPKHIQDFSDFEKIPFLTKETIRNNLDLLKATNLPPNAFYKVRTGGSTGNPLFFYHHKSISNGKEMAFIASIWKRAGFTLGSTKKLVFRGNIVDNKDGITYNPTHKEIICSTYHFDKDHMQNYLKRMQKGNIRYIHAHVSSVVTFAQFMIENDLFHQLQAVFGASEIVLPFQRELIAKAFNSRILSWYGQSEQVVLAGECEYSDNYHIFPEYGFTEIINEEGHRITSPGLPGEIVGTGFNNYAMPLIRYRTGDIGKYAQGTCKCGREYDLFAEIEGRTDEYIYTSDGRKISLTGLIFGQHYKAFEQIKEMQLFQEREGQIEIRIVKYPGYSPSDEEEIRHTIQTAVQKGLEVTFLYVDDITPRSSGKRAFLIQNLSP